MVLTSYQLVIYLTSLSFFKDLNMEFNPSDHPRASTIFLSKSQTDGRLLIHLLFKIRLAKWTLLGFEFSVCGRVPFSDHEVLSVMVISFCLIFGNEYIFRISHLKQRSLFCLLAELPLHIFHQRN